MASVPFFSIFCIGFATQGYDVDYSKGASASLLHLASVTVECFAEGSQGNGAHRDRVYHTRNCEGRY